MHSFTHGLAGTAAAVLISASAGPAAAEVFRTGYTVSYYGITVARSELTSTFADGRFTIEGRMSSSGIARVFDSTDGAMKVSGRIAEGRAVPETYTLSYEADGKKKRTTIRFRGGDVEETENVPAPKKRNPKKWVGIEPEELKAVADPLSGTILSAPSLDRVCDQTIRLYDGEMRADLKLSRAEATEWAGRAAIVCKARFVPVGGYRKNKKAIEYLRSKGDIAITFAALGSTGLFAPVHASIGTEIGTISVSADEPDATN